MDAKQEIIEQLKKAVAEVVFGGRLPRRPSKNSGLLAMTGDYKIELQEPKDEANGDYATNIAMILFGNKELGIKNKGFKTPLELAEKITSIIHHSLFIILDKVEAVAPGFINFYLSKEYLMDQLELVLDSARTIKDDEIADQVRNDKRKIMVEFTDPNPFKEFHIGHLYSNAVGESISRLLESQGSQVWRVTYQGDVGLHVAKAIWGLSVVIPVKTGIQENSGSPIGSGMTLEKVQHDTLQKRIELLGQAYAEGTKAYEENEEAKQEINALNKKIYEITNKKIATSLTAPRNDKKGTQNDIKSLYEKGREWSLEYFESIYKRLGSKFVKNYFESVAGPIGLALVKDHIADGVFKKSEGAIIFEGEKHGLHNRVFVNSLGLPTYEAKDMGLPGVKYKDYPYDESIIITAQEQSPYFTVVLKALSLINPDIAAKTKHLAHGVVRLPQGKMSSRTGNVITGEWLLDETKRLISKNYPKMDAETAEQVAVGAVKWALLKNGIGRDIAFSFEESISFEGNSGPYLQYTYARTRSVVRKSQITNPKTDSGQARMTSFWGAVRLQNLEPEEMALLRMIAKFPELLEDAAKNFAPSTVCTYLFDLGQKFNLFYQKCPILSPVILEGEKRPIGSKKDSIASLQNDNFRVLLTEATGQIIKNGLYVLGIQSPEKM